MLTRSQSRAKADYLRFERTVNLLLIVSLTSLKQGASVEIAAKPEDFGAFCDEYGFGLPGQVQTETRDDGTLSKPDAIVTVGDQQILIDAKFYETQIKRPVIEKTLDDMRLREIEHGLLVCSETSGTAVLDEMKQAVGDLNPVLQGLHYVKLIRGTPDSKVEVDEKRFVVQYLTEANLALVTSKLKEFMGVESQEARAETAPESTIYTDVMGRGSPISSSGS